MKKGRISLSEKHGVNPSMEICFWCKEPTGSIILNGRTPGDQEAPKYVCRSYNPCDKCREGFEEGVSVIEVTDTPQIEGQPSIPTNKNDGTKAEKYPTGKWLRFRPNPLNPEKSWKAGDKVVIDPEGFQEFLKARDEYNKNSQKVKNDVED
jgi:hypothetical protein